MAVWFASDIHLDDGHPELAAAFVAFIRDRVAGAERFYILGDLFETWVGDDDVDPAKQSVIDALATLAQTGTRCFFCHGNRDFLVGESFAADAGVTLMPELSVAEFYGTRVLLLHGDTLCTDDAEYQEFRRIVRAPSWQQRFLTLPLDERRTMARAARDASRNGMAQKSAAIMDVNQNAVVAALDRHGVTHMLHGHTHRPDRHRFAHASTTCTRHVLGDWYNDSAQVICWDESGARRVTL